MQASVLATAALVLSSRTCLPTGFLPCTSKTTPLASLSLFLRSAVFSRKFSARFTVTSRVVNAC